MRARPRGHAAGDLAAIEHDDGLAELAELIGGGEARNAGADDHDLGLRVGSQRFALPDVGRIHPERNALLTDGIHRPASAER